MASKKSSKKSARRSKATASKVATSRVAASRAAAPRGGKKKKAAARRGSSAASSDKASSDKAARPPKAPARKSKKVQAIPAGYGAVMPQLVVSPCAEALEFYERAFGAELGMRMPGPDGLLMHAEMSIGGSIIMLADEVNMPGEVVRRSPKSAGAITGGVMLYVEDVDAVFQRALAEGAKSMRKPTDEFWGDRFAQLQDPFGHVWSMATHVRDVSLEEMQAAMSQLPSAES